MNKFEFTTNVPKLRTKKENEEQKYNIQCVHIKLNNLNKIKETW